MDQEAPQGCMTMAVWMVTILYDVSASTVEVSKSQCCTPHPQNNDNKKKQEITFNTFSLI